MALQVYVERRFSLDLPYTYGEEMNDSPEDIKIASKIGPASTSEALNELRALLHSISHLKEKELVEEYVHSHLKSAMGVTSAGIEAEILTSCLSRQEIQPEWVMELSDRMTFLLLFAKCYLRWRSDFGDVSMKDVDDAARRWYLKCVKGSRVRSLRPSCGDFLHASEIEQEVRGCLLDDLSVPQDTTDQGFWMIHMDPDPSKVFNDDYWNYNGHDIEDLRKSKELVSGELMCQGRVGHPIRVVPTYGLNEQDRYVLHDGDLGTQWLVWANNLLTLKQLPGRMAYTWRPLTWSPYVNTVHVVKIADRNGFSCLRAVRYVLLNLN